MDLSLLLASANRIKCWGCCHLKINLISHTNVTKEPKHIGTADCFSLVLFHFE
jgi:hypothetical protein